MADLNRSVAVLTSAARTATNNSSDLPNKYYRGASFTVDVTAVPGVDTVTPSIQGKDILSGKYYTILTGSAISATGTNVLKIYPGISATVGVSVSDILPTDWRVVMTHSAGSSFTYSVAASMIL